MAKCQSNRHYTGVSKKSIRCGRCRLRYTWMVALGVFTLSFVLFAISDPYSAAEILEVAGFIGALSMIVFAYMFLCAMFKYGRTMDSHVFEANRVKSLDFHSTKPWIAVAYYSGWVVIWDYTSESLVQSFPVSQHPIRSVKFVPSRSWIATATDDMRICIIDYITGEMMFDFDGHDDFVRSIDVHPTLPYLLSAGDDCDVRCWDINDAFKCTNVYSSDQSQGHKHFVMQVKFDPQHEGGNFVSASLDSTIKGWELGCSTPKFTLRGHSEGVNCVDFMHNENAATFLVSGSDDQTVKIWDLQKLTVVKSLNCSSHSNISAVLASKDTSNIISAAEDGQVSIWKIGLPSQDGDIERADQTWNLSRGRSWSLSATTNDNCSRIAVGYDTGAVTFGCNSSCTIPSAEDLQFRDVLWKPENENKLAASV